MIVLLYFGDFLNFWTELDFQYFKLFSFTCKAIQKGWKDKTDSDIAPCANSFDIVTCIFTLQSLKCDDDDNNKDENKSDDTVVVDKPSRDVALCPSASPSVVSSIKGVDYSKRKPLTLNEQQSRFGRRTIADTTHSVSLVSLKQYPQEWLKAFRVSDVL